MGRCRPKRSWNSKSIQNPWNKIKELWLSSRYCVACCISTGWGNGCVWPALFEVQKRPTSNNMLWGSPTPSFFSGAGSHFSHGQYGCRCASCYHESSSYSTIADCGPKFSIFGKRWTKESCWTRWGRLSIVSQTLTPETLVWGMEASSPRGRGQKTMKEAREARELFRKERFAFTEFLLPKFDIFSWYFFSRLKLRETNRIPFSSLGNAKPLLSEKRQKFVACPTSGGTWFRMCDSGFHCSALSDQSSRPYLPRSDPGRSLGEKRGTAERGFGTRSACTTRD